MVAILFACAGGAVTCSDEGVTIARKDYDEVTRPAGQPPVAPVGAVSPVARRRRRRRRPVADRPQRRDRAGAGAERIGLGDRPADVALGVGHRVGHGRAAGEGRARGAGERVARAVDVGGVDARAGELAGARPVGEGAGQQVGHLGGAAQVTALDEHPAGAHRVQGVGGLDGARGVGDRDPGEQADLVEVRGHQRRAPEELGADGRHRLGGQQRLAVHRRRHRVDDERHGCVPPDPDLVGDRPDRGDDLGRGEHAGLRGADPDVGDDGPDLRGDDVGRDQVDPGDAERVLHRDGRDRDAAVDPASRHGPQVGLEPRRAAGVGAGDRQRAGRGRRHGGQRPTRVPRRRGTVRRMTEPDLRRWLDDHAHGLETLQPGTGSADLRAWLATLEGTRLLGVGEAVVGTRELVMLTHRLLKALVVESGVRTVALVAPEAATVVVDDAVAAGRDPGPAFESLGDWRWTTGDVRAAVAWLAEHNAARGDADRVRVVGVDPVSPAAAKAVGLHLRRADPDLLAEVGAGLNELVTRHAGDTALPPSVTEAVARVRARLDRDGVGEALRRHGVALGRAAEVATAAPSERAAVRDRLVVEALAGEVDAADGTAGDGPGVVWWGHAREVRVRLDDGAPWVGARLRQRYGRDYYALGLLPGEGEFRALHRRRVLRVTRHPALHRLRAAPADSVEATLGGPGRACSTCAGADRDGVPAWVGTATWMRVLGDPTPVGWQRVLEPSRPEEFDGLAHVARVRPAAVR